MRQFLDDGANSTGLTALEEFSISNCGMTTPIPSLSGLTALRSFVANYNNLTGSIPSLNGLTSLQLLVLYGAGLTGPIPSLAGLTALQVLYVKDNQLTGAMPLPGPAIRSALLCGNSLRSTGDSTADAAWDAANFTGPVGGRPGWIACQR